VTRVRKSRTAAAQRAWAAEVAAAMSVPEHAVAIQAVTLSTNAWLLHRQALSVAEQLPGSALVKQEVAQSVRKCGFSTDHNDLVNVENELGI
jgi:hypothetical protein